IGLMMTKPFTVKCHECFGRGFIVLPEDSIGTSVETKYGEHVIPSEWSKLDHVYIWFKALRKKDGTWRGIPGYVYETESGEYYAPFRGELIKVVKDTRSEFRQQ